jgi:hypothetical protein
LGSHHQNRFGIWLWKGQIWKSNPTGSPLISFSIIHDISEIGSESTLFDSPSKHPSRQCFRSFTLPQKNLSFYSCLWSVLSLNNMVMFTKLKSYIQESLVDGKNRWITGTRIRQPSTWKSSSETQPYQKWSINSEVKV